MTTFRIVHLSDLHFSQKKNGKIWAEVARYINEEIRPHAILVTGDVTDNATDAEFELARNGLNLLHPQGNSSHGPNFYIIPGNHDRYSFLGNRFWPFPRKATLKEALFNSYFADEHVTAVRSVDLTLGENSVSWKIRLVGLDSNQATWFAQGAVEETSAISASRNATGAEALKSDLVIGMVHHHVLAIPSVERRAAKGSGKRKGSLASVANVTGMLNSGVLLHHLSKAQVNILLHGHEHAEFQAVYRNGSPDSSALVVLGAGSGTGEDYGWALERIQFNLLELQPDRRVMLSRVSYNETGLQRSGGVEVLSGRDIRKARFVRRQRLSQLATTKFPQLPVSKLKKLVVVDNGRNAKISETSTNFLIGEAWAHVTANATGHLDNALVTFEFQNSKPQVYSVPFVSVVGEADAFSCGIPLNDQRSALAEIISCQWQWFAAVLLTKEELDYLPPSAKTGLRGLGREFVGITIDEGDEFESASLTLQLPDNYSLPRQDFQVYYEDPAHLGVWESSLELTQKLEFCGPSHVELRVEFPLPGFRYYISWVLPKDPTLDQSDALAKKIRDHAKKLSLDAEQEIQAEYSGSDVRVAIFCPHPRQPFALTRVVEVSGGPISISLRDPRGRPRAAFWGDPCYAWQDGNDHMHDCMEDESFVAYLPIRLAHSPSARASALLRVATLQAGGLKVGTSAPMSDGVQSLLGRSRLAASRIADVAFASK